MEHHKISKSSNDSTVATFVSKKWIEVNYLSGDQYFVNKNITFKAPRLRSDFMQMYNLLEYSENYSKTLVKYDANKNNDVLVIG